MSYLDNQVATKPCLASYEKLAREDVPYAAQEAGHRLGKKAREAIEELKERTRSYLGVDKGEVIASNSYSEVLQILFLHLYLHHFKSSGKNQILQLTTDARPLKRAAALLEPFGCVVKELDLSDGEFDLMRFKESLKPKVGLVSLSYADDFTGVVYPIEEIASLCREKGILFHLDITGIVGKVYFAKRDLCVDYLTLSGKAIHAASSIGILVATESIKMAPSIDVSLLESFVVALQQALLFLDRMGLEVVRLRALLETELERAVGAYCPYHHLQRLPHISVLSFPRVHQESLAYLLQEREIFVHLPPTSRARSKEGLPLAEGHWSSLSFALSRFTTEADIHQAIQEIKNAVEQLARFTKEIL